MPFGGLAPLPFRLGLCPDGGLDASEHARLAADLVAIKRTAPVIWMLFTVNVTAQTVTILSYSGPNGAGVRFAPLVSVAGSTVTVDFAATTNAAGHAVDVAGGLAYNWVALVSRGAAQATLTLPSSRYALTFQSSLVFTYSMVVFGASSTANIGDYGASRNKANSKTEGASTYAWQWYRAQLHAEGSAYTTADNSVRSWELKAHARALGVSQRISEMLAASATPGGSDALLSRWAARLGVQTANVPDWKIREDCEVRFGDYSPPTSSYIEDGLSEILGSTFNSVWSGPGTLTAPPDATYAPGYADGDAIYDISGDGVYSSSRARITVVVNAGALTAAGLDGIMSSDVSIWLDSNLPATKTWSWSESEPGHFVLGTSKLGIDTL